MIPKDRRERIEERRLDEIEDSEIDEQIAITEFVRGLYLKMLRSPVIVKRAAKTFAVTERTAYNHLRRIREEYRVHGEEEREEEISQIVAKLGQLEEEYEALRVEALASGDLMAAKAAVDGKRGVLADRRKLRGIDAPVQVDHRLQLQEMTDAEMREEAVRLLGELPPEERAKFLPAAGVVDVEAVEVKAEPAEET